jgi:hypothetical protein
MKLMKLVSAAGTICFAIITSPKMSRIQKTAAVKRLIIFRIIVPEMMMGHWERAQIASFAYTCYFVMTTTCKIQIEKSDLMQVKHFGIILPTSNAIFLDSTQPLTKSRWRRFRNATGVVDSAASPISLHHFFVCTVKIPES